MSDGSEQVCDGFEIDARTADCGNSGGMVGEWTRALKVGFQVYLIDLQARSRRHWLGLLWVVAPLLLVLAIGFAVQATKWPQRFADMEVPYPLYVLIGLVLWQSFAEAVLMPHRQLVTFRTELGRGVMTVEQAIVVGVFDLTFAVWLRVVFVLASVAVFGIGVGPTLLLAPFLLAGIVGIGLALGLMVALPGLLVEDIGRALGFALAVGTLACPIFYPTSGIDFLAWNPLAALIDGARAGFTGQSVTLVLAAFALLAATALLGSATAWLRKARPHFLNAIA